MSTPKPDTCDPFLNNDDFIPLPQFPSEEKLGLVEGNFDKLVEIPRETLRERRSPPARELHVLIMKYIYGEHGCEKLNAFFLRHLEEKSFLTEVSANGFNIFHDILRLPENIYRDRDEARINAARAVGYAEYTSSKEVGHKITGILFQIIIQQLNNQQLFELLFQKLKLGSEQKVIIGCPLNYILSDFPELLRIIVDRYQAFSVETRQKFISSFFHVLKDIRSPSQRGEFHSALIQFAEEIKDRQLRCEFLSGPLMKDVTPLAVVTPTEYKTYVATCSYAADLVCATGDRQLFESFFINPTTTGFTPFSALCNYDNYLAMQGFLQACLRCCEVLYPNPREKKDIFKKIVLVNYISAVGESRHVLIAFTYVIGATLENLLQNVETLKRIDVRNTFDLRLAFAVNFLFETLASYDLLMPFLSGDRKEIFFKTIFRYGLKETWNVVVLYSAALGGTFYQDIIKQNEQCLGLVPIVEPDCYRGMVDQIIEQHPTGLTVARALLVQCYEKIMQSNHLNFHNVMFSTHTVYRPLLETVLCFVGSQSEVLQRCLLGHYSERSNIISDLCDNYAKDDEQTTINEIKSLFECLHKYSSEDISSFLVRLISEPDSTDYCSIAHVLKRNKPLVASYLITELDKRAPVAVLRVLQQASGKLSVLYDAARIADKEPLRQLMLAAVRKKTAGFLEDLFYPHSQKEESLLTQLVSQESPVDSVTMLLDTAREVLTKTRDAHRAQEVVQKLLLHQDKSGISALIRAAQRSNIPAVRALLAAAQRFNHPQGKLLQRMLNPRLEHFTLLSAFVKKIMENEALTPQQRQLAICEVFNAILPVAKQMGERVYQEFLLTEFLNSDYNIFMYCAHHNLAQPLELLLAQLDSDTLLKVAHYYSPHGFSLGMEIAFIMDANALSMYLDRLRSHLSSEELEQVLLQVSAKERFNLAHYILRGPREGIASPDALIKLRIILSVLLPRARAEFLCQMTNNFTPLSQIINKQPQLLGEFFVLVASFDRMLLREVLLQEDNNGDLPLVYALQGKMLANFIQFAKPYLDPADWRRMLCHRNRSGYNILLSCVNPAQRNRAQNLQEVLTVFELSQPTEKDWIDLFTCTTRNGFYPLQQMIFSHCVDSFRLACQALNRLSERAIIHILEHANQKGLTVFDAIARENSAEAMGPALISFIKGHPRVQAYFDSTHPHWRDKIVAREPAEKRRTDAEQCGNLRDHGVFKRPRRIPLPPAVRPIHRDCGSGAEANRPSRGYRQN